MCLEDIDYIFEKGGITGGVLSKWHVVGRQADIENAHSHVLSDAADTGSNVERPRYTSITINLRCESHP